MTSLLTSIFLIAVCAIALYYAFGYYRNALTARVNLKLRAHGKKVTQLQKKLEARDEVIESLEKRILAVEHQRVPGSIPPPQNMFQKSEDRHVQEIISIDGKPKSRNR